MRRVSTSTISQQFGNPTILYPTIVPQYFLQDAKVGRQTALLGVRLKAEFDDFININKLCFFSFTISNYNELEIMHF